jgi:neutral ceramidase
MPWLVGTAREDLTPTTPIWLSGFASRSRMPTDAETALSSGALQMRVLALRQNATASALVLVSLDLIGADARLTDRIYARLLDELGLQRAAVRLCFSHTHSGPVVGRMLFPLVPEGEVARAVDYADWLVGAVVNTISRALRFERMTVAYAYYATGRCSIAVNRRQSREAAFVEKSSRGVTDDSVPVLWFRTNDDHLGAGGSGRIVAGVFGYAAHATVVTSGYTYSGDYPAAAAAALEGTGGGNASVGGTWLFLAGPGGDQNIYPRGTAALALQHGLAVAASVARVLDVKTRAAALPVCSRQGVEAGHLFVPLPFRLQRTRRELRKMASGRQNDVYTKRMARHWLLTGMARLAPKTPPTYERYPLSAWRFGWLHIVFAGGEPTIGYAELLRRAGANWVVGYADDVMGYVGTRDVVEEGKREGSDRAAVYYGLPVTWSAVVEDVIVGAVRSLCSGLSNAGALEGALEGRRPAETAKDEL